MTELITPQEGDIIYDKEPKAPWFVAQGPLVTWGVLALFLLVSLFTTQLHTVVSGVAAASGFVLSFLVHLKWCKAEAGWYAIFRWYHAKVDKVTVVSQPEAYKAAEGSRPQVGEFTLRMSNGHQLTFSQPVDWLLSAPAVIYQAFYVKGELYHQFAQPAP